MLLGRDEEAPVILLIFSFLLVGVKWVVHFVIIHRAGNLYFGSL